MKMRVILVPLAVVCALAVWSCMTMQNNPRAVVTDDHGIVIQATAFTEADQMAMNKILAKYDKELYKIDTHENGQFAKRHGALIDVFTDKKLAASIAEDVKKQGFTRSAVRVGKYSASASTIGTNSVGPATTPAGGSSSNPQRIPSGPSETPAGGSGSNPQRIRSGPSATPAGGSGSNPQRIKQDQLINELMPILEKYNK